MNDDATFISSLPTREFAKEIISNNAKDGIENPFFVVDIDDLFYKIDLLRKHMPRVKPFYAVKCNNDPVVLEVLASLDIGFDCASIAEIETMVSLGVDPSRIIYAHPQKHVTYLRRAWKQGVDLMTFDCAHELYKIKEHYPSARLVLRLKVENRKAWFRLGDKFGCSETEAVELLHMAKALEMAVVGVCFHVGGGNEDASAFATAIAAARRIFDVGRDMGFDITLLDIGGGFPREPGCHPLFIKTADIVNECLEEYFPENYGVTVISEPGGFVVSSAFFLCTKIIGKRMCESSDEIKQAVCMYYINESTYKSFMMVIYNEEIARPEPLEEVVRPTQPSMVWGITCDSSDKIKAACSLPDMDVGEWMAFPNMGAYSTTVTSPFNGFPDAEIHYRASKCIQ
ncbi:ornithine decarboxylase [Rhipicephalus sanguineus]|uniref:ornithine decarboxylase n=1 Tax=Rhipicephalus sanguineus TaxID=34632 RepID=UPI0020C2ECA6|nr:ornithine decarboxylase [Rhipicephalus sanguineus]